MSIATLWDELVALRQRVDPHWNAPKPKPPEQLAELQQRLGVDISEDILQWISLCAGATSVWSEPDTEEQDDAEISASEAAAGEEETFDYGDVSFLTLEEIVSEYEARRSLASQMEAPANVVGPVRAAYFNKSCIPLASDIGAGRFAIDLNPPKGGVAGQVLWMNDEASIVRVI